MRFESLHTVLNNASKISEVKAWFDAMDKKTQQFIISMNTHEQLGEDGIDSNDRSLGEYAPFTINFRRSKGLQVDHIDFHVTGWYWGTWKVDVKKDHFVIHTDEQRFDELVDLLRFSPDHVGLTDLNKERLGQLIAEKYADYIREQLLPRD